MFLLLFSCCTLLNQGTHGHPAPHGKGESDWHFHINISNADTQSTKIDYRNTFTLGKPSENIHGVVYSQRNILGTNDNGLMHEKLLTLESNLKSKDIQMKNKDKELKKAKTEMSDLHVKISAMDSKYKMLVDNIKNFLANSNLCQHEIKRLEDEKKIVPAIFVQVLKTSSTNNDKELRGIIGDNNLIEDKNLRSIIEDNSKNKTIFSSSLDSKFEEMDNLLTEKTKNLKDTWAYAEKLEKLVAETMDQLNESKKKVSKLENRNSWLRAMSEQHTETVETTKKTSTTNKDRDSKIKPKTPDFKVTLIERCKQLKHNSIDGSKPSLDSIYKKTDKLLMEKTTKLVETEVSLKNLQTLVKDLMDQLEESKIEITSLESRNSWLNIMCEKKDGVTEPERMKNNTRGLFKRLSHSRSKNKGATGSKKNKSEVYFKLFSIKVNEK